MNDCQTPDCHGSAVIGGYCQPHYHRQRWAIEARIAAEEARIADTRDSRTPRQEAELRILGFVRSASDD